MWALDCMRQLALDSNGLISVGTKLTSFELIVEILLITHVFWPSSYQSSQFSYSRFYIDYNIAYS